MSIVGGNGDKSFDFASITLAAPETIRRWSSGEVKNPETINYRTFKPEKGGLFCERIFGPTRDWECSCGKYKRIKHKNVICDRCGVEVTKSSVRRDRMGHIELAVPVSHIWFFKCSPSRMGNVLDMTARNLERILYYEDYVVIDPGETPLQEKQLLSEIEYRENQDKFGETAFIAKMGAEGVRDLMERLNYEDELQLMQDELRITKSKQNRKKIAKRMKIIEGLRKSNARPEWMILEVLPVIPPDLRPLVPLEGGRFATSDLNDLYRRVINRNNRLKNLLQLKTPDVIIRNEKRMLQEAVDALFDNGRHGRAVTGAGNRPLKSMSDMLKGKQGRFRQNLLGKRVDYSGRSVIVVGPDLKLNQCGLPKKMALVLFEPFIIRRLKAMGVVHNVKSAKKMIEREDDHVWDILEEVTSGHTVMLNRAPTLHRLSIQSFEPKLIEGEAIRLHPLVCTAYNADFDGDQMAVHVPLSIEAQLESRLLMLAPNNIFAPASGKPITTPTQDIALGCYYLSMETPEVYHRLKKIEDVELGHLDGSKLDFRIPIFGDIPEVHSAFDEGDLQVHDVIRIKNDDFGVETKYGNSSSRVIATTVGRVFFNEIWPPEIGFVNRKITKKLLGQLIWDCYKLSGHAATVVCLDKLKNLGFEHATRGGISIGMKDMIIPDEKKKRIGEATKQVSDVEKQYQKGVITAGERYNRIIDIWTDATNDIGKVMFDTMERNQGLRALNPVYMMVDSGARGSQQQIRQLAGMRGLMAKPSGDIIERPIIANFREGLSVMEYFISTHGARKGLADTALKTADSGYLTRKLVDVAQDIIVVEQDCNTMNGIKVSGISEGDEEVVALKTRIVGRTSLNNIRNPRTNEIIVAASQEIDEEAADRITECGIEEVAIRSVLTCESRRGICARCYGRNMANGLEVQLGMAVGIIAAQSIGEPGTQLTMRTFHIGGTASSTFKKPQIIAKNNGVVRYLDLRMVKGSDGSFVVLNKTGSIAILDDDGRELEHHNIVLGSIVSVEDGGQVTAGDAFVKWDPHNVPILAETSGEIEFKDFIEGVTYRRENDESTGLQSIVIMEHKEDMQPQIVMNCLDDSEKAASSRAKPKPKQLFYSIPSGATVTVKEHETVFAGTVIAKTSRKTAQTKDITGGLPRVAELFEARRPKDAAEIAKIDGLVEFAGNARGKRRILVRDQITGEAEEHLIPIGKHVTVFQGDQVKKGQQLTEGPIVPQEILEVSGPHELQEYLVNQVQEVYRMQGVEINDKHIEVIVRQMLRKVRVTDPGETEFLWNEQIEKYRFNEENKKACQQGRKPAEAATVLLGITKASLETESFISAASFQDTTRVLTEAATLGRIDYLRGFKENVIMGHLIPAGSGFHMYRNIKLIPLADPISLDELLGDDLLGEAN
ncbi:MAG: DNA-directed RNA polymerase subunit beta' [Spartobacteria bacterium]|nr:DNA-directed RNA polymerase subunit beta' [Spartobacteria bacterium]